MMKPEDSKNVESSMRKIAIAVVSMLAMVMAGGLSSADSLWVDSTGAAPSIYTDVKARTVGDVLTIVIVESSTGTTQANTKTASTDSIGGGPGVGSGVLKLLANLPEFSADTKSSSSGTGNTSRSGSLSARVSVVVKNVLPNGTLAVEGTREVTINKEKQEIKLTGIIRPQDVAADNTVLSTSLADAKIEYTGNGPISRKQRGGLLTRIFDFLF